jgi:hypothetical protein
MERKSHVGNDELGHLHQRGAKCDKSIVGHGTDRQIERHHRHLLLHGLERIGQLSVSVHQMPKLARETHEGPQLLAISGHRALEHTRHALGNDAHRRTVEDVPQKLHLGNVEFALGGPHIHIERLETRRELCQVSVVLGQRRTENNAIVM